MRSLEGHGWKTLPYFALRMAGFPFALLDDLASGTVVTTALRLVAAQIRITNAIAASHDPEVLDHARSKAEGAALRAIRKRRLPGSGLGAESSTVVRAVVSEFAEALAELDDAEREFDRAYCAVEEETSFRLLNLFRESPELRDVILASNEKSEPVLVRWLEETGQPGWRLRNNDDFRYKLDTLVRHLQRVSAKNDTASHLGPFALGQFDPDAPGFEARHAELARFPVIARWAAQCVAELAQTDPQLQPHSAPRRAPGAFLNGDELNVITFDYSSRLADLEHAMDVRPPVRLTPEELAVYHLCNGVRTVRQICSQANMNPGSKLTGEDTGRVLRRLELLGAIAVGPELPYGVPDSLPILRSLVGGSADSGWRALTARAEAACTEFAGGSRDQRRAVLDSLKGEFSTLTGASADRGMGTFYGDRSLIHEDCLGRFADMRIGGPLTTLLVGELPVVYDLMMAAPRQRRAAESALLDRWFAERFGTRAEVPLHRFLSTFKADARALEPEYQLVDAEEAALFTRIQKVLIPADRWDDHGVDVDPKAVGRLVAQLGNMEPAMCNPDLMIAASSPDALRSDDFRVVVSELHANEENLSHGIFGPFLAGTFERFANHVLEGYRSLLADDEELADVTLLHRNKSYIRTELDCLEIEAYERSSRSRDRVFALADLSIERTAVGLRLRKPGRDTYLRMIALPFWWLSVRRNPFVPFGFPYHSGRRLLPVPGSRHVPRLTMGRVVLQREFWRVAPEQVTASHYRAAFLKVQELRSCVGLPRYLFARVPGETKPIFCDLDSPLLVRQLTRFAGQANGSDLELTEMYPPPAELWASDKNGCYTSELRYAAFSPPR